MQLVINADKYYVMMKKDVKDAFRNILVVPQNRWLLVLSGKEDTIKKHAHYLTWPQHRLSSIFSLKQ